MRGFAEGMRKDTSISFEIHLVRPVVLFEPAIGIAFAQQVPVATAVGIRQSTVIPVGHPLWVLVVVVVAGLEIATVGRIPESLTYLSSHGHGASILSGNTEYLRLPSRCRRKGIRESRYQHRPRRPSIGTSLFLCRVELGAFTHLLAGRNQRMFGIFDVIGQLACLIVVPDIADQTVGSRMRAGREGSVPDDGFGVGVLVVRIGIDHALLEQVTKPTVAEVRSIALEQIAEPCVLVGAGVGAYVALLLGGSRPEKAIAALLLEGAGLDGGGSLPGHEAEAEDVEGFERFIASASSRYRPSTDPLVAQCERDLRPLDYVTSFARAAKPMLYSGRVGRDVSAPDWWSSAREANRGVVASDDLVESLAELEAMASVRI